MADNKVLYTDEAIRDIVKRLNNNSICFKDINDDSTIVIDKDLVGVVRRYFEGMLVSSNG